MSWTGTVCLLTYFVITTTAVKCDQLCYSDGRNYQDYDDLTMTRSFNPDQQSLYQAPCLQFVEQTVIRNSRSTYGRHNNLGYDNLTPYYPLRQRRRPFKDLTFTFGGRRSMDEDFRRGGRRQLRQYAPFQPQYQPYQQYQYQPYPQYPVPGAWGGGGYQGGAGANAGISGNWGLDIGGNIGAGGWGNGLGSATK